VSIKEILERLFRALGNAVDSALNYPIDWLLLVKIILACAAIILACTLIIWIINALARCLSSVRKLWRESQGVSDFFGLVLRKYAIGVAVVSIIVGIYVVLLNSILQFW
jgi:hypothetical protein